MPKRIVLDTNILIDFYSKREEFYETAHLLIVKLIKSGYKIYIPAYSIPTIFYVLRKNFTLVQNKDLW